MGDVAEVPFKATKAQRPYQPFGTAKKFIECRDPEVLYAGPAGTGKTIAALVKLYLVCHKYPGCRCLIVRKTRESLSEAALVTWEQKVVPEGHPMLSGPQRRMRQVYDFGNGSQIVVGGLDKSQKVMSTEYDIVYAQECIEVTEEDWENLTTRLRNNRMPYQQIIADTNPSFPTHWLKRRCDSGRTTMIESRHEDNPTLFDQRTGLITPNGVKYIAKLDALTGVRKARLRYGKWVQAEGAVYENWDDAVHVVDDFFIPPDWERFWTVDFGYTVPFVLQMWAEDPNGSMYLFRELYQTKLLVEDAAAMAKKMMDEDLERCRQHVFGSLPNGQIDEAACRLLDELPTMIRPTAIICDHDREDRATLERHLGMQTRAANKAVEHGIQEVASRLKVMPHGKPGIMILRGARFNPVDEHLRDTKKPTCTREEMEGYRWEDSASKDKPVKEDDHGADALRYGTMYKYKKNGFFVTTINL